MAAMTAAMPSAPAFRIASSVVAASIFLTASGDERSVVKGFDSGAYDYISKPFRPLELLSRIKSVLRRAGTQSCVEIANLSVDTDKGIVKKNGAVLELSALEYRLLMVFINNRGILLSRKRSTSTVAPASMVRLKAMETIVWCHM